MQISVFASKAWLALYHYINKNIYFPPLKLSPSPSPWPEARIESTILVGCGVIYIYIFVFVFPPVHVNISIRKFGGGPLAPSEPFSVRSRGGH